MHYRGLLRPKRHAEFHMGELVNLRTARKQAKRRHAEADAAIKRLVHGRSKSERMLERSRDEKARKDLDQKRIGTGEEQ
jgi:hypothetical protein